MPDRCSPAAATRVRAYIGLGSNLDDPEAQVRRAIGALRALPRTRWVGSSGLYRSTPLTMPPGDAGQPDYVNAVAALDTELGAHALLDELHAIEAAHGRDRSAGRWASRTLDLDLLLYGAERHADACLTVPHPGIGVREFVLYPLYELDPELVVPGIGPIRDRLRGLDPRGLVRLEGRPGEAEQ